MDAAATRKTAWASGWRRERSEVEPGRQLRRKRRTPELERRWVGRLPDDLDLRLVDLDAARRLLGRDSTSGHRHHHLGRQPRQPLRLRATPHDHLGMAAAIANDQERDAAELPLAMKPAGEPHRCARVLAQLASKDPSHEWHLQSSQSPPGAGGRRPRGATALRLR